MTYLGKNIKKIRSIRKLSQMAFADLFGVSRASVGAYEEGRAEAKLETIMAIANYFSVSVDDLLTKELTVNELYHFNIFDDKIAKPAGNVAGATLVNLVEVPLYHAFQLYGEFDSKEIAKIIIPGNSLIEYIAVIITKYDIVFSDSLFQQGDVVVLDTLMDNFDKNREQGSLCLFKIGDKLLLADVLELDSGKLCYMSMDGLPLVVERTNVEFIYPVVKYLNNNYGANSQRTGKMQRLESQVMDIYKRIL
ncbi:MAG: helix-turn-helix domain-containing protein [Bacteroidales bacterium]|nr:helix-turn-helix domain-containing protein [Bacteroidales bacterium]